MVSHFRFPWHPQVQKGARPHGNVAFLAFLAMWFVELTDCKDARVTESVSVDAGQRVTASNAGPLSRSDWVSIQVTSEDERVTQSFRLLGDRNLRGEPVDVGVAGVR